MIGQQPDTRRPAVVMVHTDPRTRDMTTVTFYSQDEALDWLAEQFALLRNQL